MSRRVLDVTVLSSGSGTTTIVATVAIIALCYTAIKALHCRLCAWLLRQRYKRDGYVVIRSFLSKREVAFVLDEINNRLLPKVVPGMPREHVFYEDKYRKETLKQLQRLHDHDRDGYFGALFRGRALHMAETLIGAGAVGKNMQFFNKVPGESRATPPHQDGYYFMIKKPQNACTMWLSLDHADDENGCLHYVAGSAEGEMRPHQPSGVLGFSQMITDYNEEDRSKELEMRASPGDLVVHNSLMIHRAGANVSRDRPRRALGFIYYGADAVVDEEAHAAYQKRLSELNAQKNLI